MSNTQLPHKFHVMRYCDPRYVADKVILDDAFVIEKEAFDLKKDEAGLSVCCPEKIDAKIKLTDMARIIPEVCTQLSSQLSLKNGARLALLNVGTVIEKIKPQKRIKIISIPEEGYPSHSETRGYTAEDNRKISRIIRKCILTTFPLAERSSITMSSASPPLAEE